jgi:hypothetical protein
LVIAALFTLLPFSIQDLPSGWKFAPIIIAGVILSLTVHHSRRNKSNNVKLPIKLRWTQFTRARRVPEINLHEDNAKKIRPEPSIKNGIQHYENRSQLSFDEMISKAERTVEISAITFRIATLSNYNTLKGILSRKVHLIFLILNPDSTSISIQREIYHGSEDLKEQIQKSLQILCDLKNKFNDSVDIRLYDSISTHSTTIIDRENPDEAWIQVESRPVGSDPNSRPIDVAYRKENTGFFNEHLKEYDILFEASKIYDCYVS